MSTVVVVGGTGSIGRLVATRLLEPGDQPRVLTRNPDRARRALPDGVEVVAGDIADAATLTVALDGVEAVVLTHGAPYGSGDYETVDYGAVPAVLDVLDGRQVRVALMTSIGVTTSGSSRDLLTWKRRGERLLRASGLPYTIVRPGWFDAGSGDEDHIDIKQGDQVDYGSVRREHVAEVLVQAIHTGEAVGRTVEVFSSSGPVIDDWSAVFGALDADSPPSIDGAHDQANLPLNGEPARVRSDLQKWHVQ